MGVLQYVHEYLASCFELETPPQVSEVAQALGVTASCMTRRFATVTGRSLGAYFREQQVVRAAHLLRTTTLPLNSVGYRAAFGTRATFFRTFKRVMGITPHAYRQLHSNDGRLSQTDGKN